MSEQDEQDIRTRRKDAVQFQVTDGTDEVDVATHGAAHKDKGLMLLGSDGTNALRLSVDENGRPQVDVISSALPADAATESTLDTLVKEVTFTGRIGEVDPNPTANTLLARLKTIADQQLADGHAVEVNNLPATYPDQHSQPLTDAQLRDSPIPVTLEDAGFGTPMGGFEETAALAAQADETLEFPLGNNVTASLKQIVVSSPNPFQAIIQKVDEGATTTTIAVLHGNAGDTKSYEPQVPRSGLNQVASDGTPSAKYQVVCKNTNASSIGSSSKIFVTAEWQEVDN